MLLLWLNLNQPGMVERYITDSKPKNVPHALLIIM